MTGPSTAEPAVWGSHFELPGGAHALFTTRAAGNLSTGTGPAHDQGAAARFRLRSGLGLAGLCNGRQVHGTVVRQLREAPAGGLESVAPDGAEAVAPDGAVAVAPDGAEAVAPDGAVAVAADGHATGLRGVGAMVLVADCIPLVLASEGAVAAVHAGWRGLASGVLEEGVRALGALTVGESEVVAVIGPCAGVCCYEVGPEVHEAFGGGHRSGRFLDLRAIACERLARVGVVRVEHVERCTICDLQFFSHRREGERAGRQAGLAWLS